MVTHISSSFFPEVIYGVEDLAFRFAYNAEVSSLWGRREMPWLIREVWENWSINIVSGR